MRFEPLSRLRSLHLCQRVRLTLSHLAVGSTTAGAKATAAAAAQPTTVTASS